MGSGSNVDPTCPFCEGIPGVGSQPPDRANSFFNEPILVGADVVLVPTVGMLMPGYLMAVTTQHVLSFADAGRGGLDEVDGWISRLLDSLAPSFGNYLIFEHGSGGTIRPVGRGSGACLVHAHLHLIPGVADLFDSLQHSLGASPLSSLQDLSVHSDVNYALLGRGGQWSVAPSVALPGQWIRRQVAAHLGRPDEYDWALFRGDEHLEPTLTSIPDCLPTPP
jgi:hypothetical protein